MEGALCYDHTEACAHIGLRRYSAASFNFRRDDDSVVATQPHE